MQAQRREELQLEIRCNEQAMDQLSRAMDRTTGAEKAQLFECYQVASKRLEAAQAEYFGR